MKKITILFASMMVLASLSGCGNSSSSATSTNTPTTNTISVAPTTTIPIDPETQFTVTLNLNYNNQQEFKKVGVDKNTIFNSLANMPSRDGFMFYGWYWDMYCINPWVEGTIVTQDITLYARWELFANGNVEIEDTEVTKTYKITYKAGANFSYVNPEGALVKSADSGEIVSFKIATDRKYADQPKVVKANGVEIQATEGLYSYTITSDTTFSCEMEEIIVPPDPEFTWVGNQDFYIQMGEDWQTSKYQFKVQLSSIHQCDEYYWSGYIEKGSAIQFRRETKTLPDTTVSGHGLALDQTSTQNLLQVNSSIEHGLDASSNLAWYNGTDGQMTFQGETGYYQIYIRVYDNSNADGAQNDRWLNIYMAEGKII